ncbi:MULTISPECIES: phosphate ABC transporter permease subunit PstC [Candidatus Ichthyocystis]|uniref:Phosphate transport system permease protein n=1 Tax=Candidatus Ichthyocystis hellenicum TaxID=1561003 RepID=A0A0S4M4D4_9BURK|nr:MULTISPECIES: phosphate ABC transporter permease subunit PstC [Ichthyocystis]CUT17836.1 Phosphate transport system permease protein [Candidatus Ichthyocystis hellenicum]
MSDYVYRSNFKIIKERIVVLILFCVAFFSILVTVGIVFLLLKESLLFFKVIPVTDFLFGTKWSPLFSNGHYGVLPLLSATLIAVFVSLFFAIPSGTLIAIYLSEFSSPLLREIVKPILELLGGVPTVAYGYFALTFVTPIFQKILPSLPGFNLLSAGLVMGLMIIPYITSLSEDAMRVVPYGWREASYALGATRFQTACRVVYPSAFSGIFSGYILAISRVLGETMIVSIAAGAEARMVFHPFQPGQTMTAYIVQIVAGDVPYEGFAFRTVFVVGLLLFIITLIFNLLGQWIRKRFRCVY